MGKDTLMVEIHDTHQGRVENRPIAQGTLVFQALLLTLQCDVFLGPEDDEWLPFFVTLKD